MHSVYIVRLTRERLTARPDQGFVVFLIGMRVNRPWKVHKWLPVAQSMPRMLKQLMADPDSGLLSAEVWFGRTVLSVQYWESTEKLIQFALDPEKTHILAWKAFNRAVGASGDVGIFHETYVVEPGKHESLYFNMPPFGLGKATKLVPAEGFFRNAEGRLKSS